MPFELSSLDTRKAADEGVWFTLEDVDGKEMEADGEPVRFRLLGRDSAVAVEAMRDFPMDASKADMAEIYIVEWSENVNASSAREIAEVPYIADWVALKVTNRVNFMPKPQTK